VRRRVLDAARREFADRGFDGVSLELIAAAAGFSKGAVYSNFATKADLFLALMDESVSARIEAALEVVATSGPAPGPSTARRLGDRLIAQFSADTDWQLLLVEFWMRAVRDPTAREPFVRYRRRLRQVIADEIDKVFPDGDPELSSHDIATTILALSNGIAIERILDPEAAGDSLFGVVLGRLFGRATPS